MVGDDDIGAGAFNGGEDFADQAFLINPAVGGSCFHHGKLSAYIISSNRCIEGVFYPADHIQVTEGGFHHYNIRTFLEVEFHFTKRLVAVSRVHLVSAAIAKLWSAFCSIAKGAVKTGSIFGRVGHDRRL